MTPSEQFPTVNNCLKVKFCKIYSTLFSTFQLSKRCSLCTEGKKNLIFQNFTPGNVEDSNFFLDTLHFDERLIDSMKQLMGFMGKLMGECGPRQRKMLKDP
ncbi:hypothetical protein T01_404 [Trichinella spiralis]|uniref:Uncharacterized protein n=1 Tax=Trichinella spiralis TaxID=6334 RepID=A0A0V1BV42_TRISP|nr:hypothetical protein T01_404 [Trichinella spiralis]